MNNTPNTPVTFRFDAPVRDTVAANLERIDLVRTIGPVGRQTRTSVGLVVVRTVGHGTEVKTFIGRPDARYSWGNCSVSSHRPDFVGRAVRESKSAIIRRLRDTGDLPHEAAEALLDELDD